ncbi:MAG: flippase [Candidatus Pacebacteria bacterium]|nr:flippase [Candidatus Paceibacterota bacterium]
MTELIINLRSLFFENKTIKQTLLKNSFWIGISGGICKALRALLVIYIARALGPTDYGKFAFALAFVSLFVSFFDMGLSNIITREFAKKERHPKDFYSLFWLKIILGIAGVMLILMFSFLAGSSPEIKIVIWVLALVTFLNQVPELFYAFFRSREKMEYESLINLFQAVLLVLVIYFLAHSDFFNLLNISISYFIAGLIPLIMLFVFFSYKFFPLKFVFDFKTAKDFLRMSFPLALTSVSAMIFGYIDSTILGISNQVAETGYYNAALRIINIIILPAGIITLSFYPLLSRFYREDKRKFQRVFDVEMSWMVILAVPILIGGLVLAPQVINFVYGPSYNPSTFAFQILLIMVFIFYIQNTFSQLLIVINQEWKTFWMAFIGALANIVLNIFLIFRFSFYGAALASLITYIIMLILSLIFVKKSDSVEILSKDTFLAVLGSVLAGFVMYFVIAYPKVYYANILISVLLGSLVYFFALFVFNYLLTGFVDYLTSKEKR